MCEQGVDTDYGKPVEVLNKLEPPYFAIPFPTDGNMAGGLVTLTGMFCDRHGQVRAQRRSRPSRVCLRPATAWVGASASVHISHQRSVYRLRSDIRLHGGRVSGRKVGLISLHAFSHFPRFPFQAAVLPLRTAAPLREAHSFSCRWNGLQAAFRPSVSSISAVRLLPLSSPCVLVEARGCPRISTFLPSQADAISSLLREGSCLFPCLDPAKVVGRPARWTGGRGFRSARSGEVRLEDWRT